MLLSTPSLLPRWRRLTLLLVAFLGLAATSCSDDDDTGTAPAPPRNIVQVAQANPDFSILVAAVTKADLATTLSGTGPFTVFAPTNAAFAKLSAPFNTAASITAITDAAQIAALRDILLYHVLAGNKKAADLSTGPQTTQKAAGATTNIINLTKTGNAITINTNTTVVTADVAASNGTIHAIDNVLMPASTGPGNIVQVAQGNADFSILVAAVVKADLAATLSGTGPFTVFAPTNAAFTKLAGTSLDAFSSAAKINAVTDAAQIAALRGVLLYHAVGANIRAADIAAGSSSRTTARPASAAGVNDNTIYLSKTGSGVFINGSTRVVTADVAASNGTIHAIDNVLLPPTQTIAAIVQANATASTPQFSLLLQALQRPAAATLLTAAANNAANVTVFAPTDAAFRALLTALGLQNLSQVPDNTLVAVLQKHVVASGRVFSSDLVPGSVTTLNGSVTIAAAGTGFTVRGGAGTAANITAANILATNGVIHVIDQVIQP